MRFRSIPRYNEMMATKPIIFVFTTAYAPFVGGAELAVQEIARRLKNDFEFIIITARLRRDLLKREQVPEGTVRRVGLGLEAIDKLLLPFCGAFLVLRIMQRRRNHFFVSKHHPVMFWGIMISYASIAAFFLKFFYPKVPLVITLQEGNKEWERGLSKWWWRILLRSTKVNYITAISNFLKDRAREAGYKGPISVVPNGVGERLLKIVPHSSTPGVGGIQTPGVFPRGALVIFSASRLVYKNGIDILLEAAAKLKEEYNFKVILAGDGPERKYLELQTINYKLQTRVTFLGYVPYERLTELYQQSDIFVRPSRSEGLGSAFLEAMAAGCITIGTPVGGIPDFLIDGSTGFLSKPEDSDDLVRVLRKALVMNDDERHAMIQRVRAVVRERYLWDAVAQQMKEIFIKISDPNKSE